MHLHNMHAYKETFVPVIYRHHQIISGICISIWYWWQNTPKVSVSEVSVNCDISLSVSVTVNIELIQ